MKKILLSSMVAAALVFTGCGSDDNTTTPPAGDTENPVVSATATAEIDSTVVLATDNVGVATIVLGGTAAGSFAQDGTTITTPATAGDYNITVTATDAAGNTSGEVAVVVTVTDSTPVDNDPENSVDLGANGKWIVIQTVDVEDNNTTDVNETSFARISQADATAYCGTLPTGWAMPSRDDILSIATSDVSDPLNIVGQIVLDTSVLEAGTAAATSVIWTSNGTNTGVYLGNPTTDGNADYVEGDDTAYFHTCVKK